MKIKELNRKIFHNSSQISQSDYLNIIENCYSQVSGHKDRDNRMKVCVEKWQQLYNYLGS